MDQENYRSYQKLLNAVGGISITTGLTDEEKVRQHTHDFDEIAIVLGGSGYQHFDDARYFVTTGDVFVVRGDVLHYFTDNHNLLMYNIGFQPWVIEPFAPLLQQLPGYHTLFLLEPACRKQTKFSRRLHLNATDLQILREMLDNLTAEYHTAQPGREFFVTSLFMQITGFLCRKHFDLSVEDHNTVGACARIIEYIERNYGEEITLEQLSNVAGMSKNGVISMFKRLYGATPIQYINNLRLYKACDLLKNTDLPISQIAFQCGFSDSNYFSRVFKAMRGISPRAFRQL